MPEPYYRDENVTLYLGDCAEITEWLAADVLVTDPPYGIGWKRGSGTGAGHTAKAHKGIINDQDTTTRNRALTLWGDDKPALVFGSMKASFPPGWKRVLVFEKPRNSGLVGTRIPWFNNWEPVFVLGRWPDQTPTLSAIVSTSEKQAGGYSGYATKTGHPHTKPHDVMTHLIQACPPGTIADPFAGSGSTLLAAKHLGRQAFGVELSEEYCETAARRLAQGVFDLATLESGGHHG